jgi:hypothetical protein
MRAGGVADKCIIQSAAILVKRCAPPEMWVETVARRRVLPEKGLAKGARLRV